MKTPDYAIDRKKFEKFWDRIQKEAKKLFPDESGDSRVSVFLRDCTREMDTNGLPVAHQHNLETDAEWREAISRLSCNVKIATEKLDAYIRIYDMDRRTKEGFRSLQDEVIALGDELDLDINLGNEHKAPEGMRWSKPFGVTTKDYAIIQIDNLFGFGDSVRKELLSWVKAVIEKWVADYHGGEPLPPFKLVINSNFAYLYVAVKVGRKP